jgi:hypothetical protein
VGQKVQVVAPEPEYLFIAQIEQIVEPALELKLPAGQEVQID